MGMFDYLACEMALPEGPQPAKGTIFQTKDTDAQYLERYTIAADGCLVHHSLIYQEVPEDERPYPDMPFVGSVRSIPAGDILVPAHGDIKFYHRSNAGEWWEYVARFTEGRCVRIWLAEHSPPEGPRSSSPAGEAA